MDSSIPPNIANNQHVTMYARTDASTGIVTVIDGHGNPLAGAPIGMTYPQWEQWAATDILKRWYEVNKDRDYSSDIVNLSGDKENRFKDEWYKILPPLRSQRRAYPSQIAKEAYGKGTTRYYPV